MSGPEILEASGGITVSVHIIPDKSAFNFDELITGKVEINLNKPIFFVDEGQIQLTLEGKEVFQYEEGGVAPAHSTSRRVDLADKFYRNRQVIYDSKNQSDVFSLRTRMNQTKVKDSVFLEAGKMTFPFSIELEQQNKKPASFSLCDQALTLENEQSESKNKISLQVLWTLRLKAYGKYKLKILQQHIDGEVLGKRTVSSSVN